MTNPTALAARPATAPGVYAAEDLSARLTIRLVEIEAEILDVTESLAGNITLRLRLRTGGFTGIVTRHFLRDADVEVI